MVIFMQKLKRIIAIISTAIMVCVVFPTTQASAISLSTAKTEYSSICLADVECVDEGHYTGNQGDSRVFRLDAGEFNGYEPKGYYDGGTQVTKRNGNIGVDGTVYNNGFEVWIARWNFGDNISWAYRTFKLGGNYHTLTGESGLIKSYNTSNFDSTVYFYEGNNLLYSFRITNQEYEFDFSIDVEGVEELKVMIKDNTKTAGGTSFALYNLFLDGTNESEPYKIYIWEDDQEKTIETTKSIDEYVSYIPSMAYSSELSYMMMGFADGSYDPNRLEKSLQSHGFRETFYADSLYDATKAGKTFTLDGLKLAFSSTQEATNYLAGLFCTEAAFTISKKVSTTGDNVVLITVRGSTTVADWIGNFEFITGSGSHPNFQKCADLIYQCLEYYTGGIDKSNTKYLITGHSRGAVVANLLSVKLIDNGIPQANLYDYNFACPDVAVDTADWSKGGKYSSIFNICCYNDPVAYLPGVAGDAFLVGLDDVLFGLNERWGKYGITRWFAHDWSNTEIKVSYHLQPNYLRSLPGLSFGAMRDKSECPKQSIKNIRIKCPVNATIYNSDDQPIAAIINDKIVCCDTSKAVYSFVRGDKKSFSIFDNTDFYISMTGTAEGKMSIDAQDIDLTSGEILFKKEYKNIALEKGKLFKGLINVPELISSIEIYGTNENSDLLTIIDTDGSETKLDDIEGKSCPYCHKNHSGFFGVVIGFFHKILYFFAHLFEKMRRCVKSYLLNTIFRNYLSIQGIPQDHILSYELDLTRDIRFRNPLELAKVVR